MSDTQWPRWIVFDQPRESAPHNSAGSIHAPDPEIAMMNARDVFVRRPETVSLWVVRESHIFSKTAEELTEDPDWLEKVEPEEGELETYYVFQKLGHRSKHTHVGEVEGTSPEGAMQAALEAFPPGTGRRQPVVWWVAPARRVVHSTPEDIEMMFEIAKRKPFRDQKNFLVQTKLREARGDVWEKEEAPDDD